MRFRTFMVLTLLGLLCLVTLAPAAQTVTTPLQQYGLGYLYSASLSSDGKRILSTGGGKAYLWDLETGKVIRSFSAAGHNAGSVAFSSDCAHAVTGAASNIIGGPPVERNAKIWDVNTGIEVQSLTGHNDQIWCIAYSPDDSQIVTASRDGTAKLWDVASGALVKIFIGHSGPIHCVAFSPDGKNILTGSADHSVRLWDIDTGSVIKTFLGHTDTVGSVSFSPTEKKIATASFDFTARIWNLETAQEIHRFSGYGYMYGAVFSPDGTQLLTGTGQRKAILWNVEEGDKIKEFIGHDEWCSAVGFTPDGKRILTASGDMTMKLWDVSTSLCIRTYTGHTSNLYAANFSPNGDKIITGHGDPEPKLWEMSTGDLIRTFTGSIYYYSFYSTAFSPDGTLVLTGSRYDARLWRTDTGELLRVFNTNSGMDNDATFVCFNASGTQILTSNFYSAGSAKLWDINNNITPLWTIPEGTGHNAVFSPDGSKIFAGKSLWDIATRQKIWTLTPSISIGTNFCDSVDYAPDGTKIVTGGYEDNIARIWDASSGTVIRNLVGHSSYVYAVKFSPDGTKVLTGSDDTTAKLWDVETGTEIQTFSAHNEDVSSVDFSSDGTKALVGSYSGTAFVWELMPPRAIILVGGGDYPGNPIAQQTNDLSAYAYKALKRRKYNAEDIQYLSAFGPTDADGDGLNDTDDWATLESFEQAVTGNFAPGAGRLMILMIDHGHRTTDFMVFRIDETQVLPSTTLDAWLDTLQATCPADVTLVVDSCYSGQFVEDCRGAPAGRKRIVVASTGPNAEAVFMPPPDMTSFMHTFLGSAYMGNSMGEAWRAGKRFFEEFPVADQVPQLDDGTTGTAKADKEFFGATWMYGVQSTEDVNRFLPAFEDWTTNTLVTPGTPVTLWTRMLPGQNPLEVVAVVRPPAPEVISGDPVTNLPHVALEPNPGDPSLWEAVTTDTFTARGSYIVSFTARFEYERISNPVFTRITVSEGIDLDATPIRAILVIGATENSALATAFEALGPYAYSVYLDRFQDDVGIHHPEWIEYLTPFPDADRDGTPSSSAILDSINNLSVDIGRLYVHLIGDSDVAGEVQLSTGNSLSASALDTALDDLQGRQDCLVVLFVDAPYSGAFLPICKATGTQQRVILTGSRANDIALFLEAPTLTSFSQKFLATTYQGNHLLQGFRSGLDFFQTFLLGLIEPQLDDTGDGEYKPWEDGALAQTLYLGRRYAFAGNEAAGLPFILDVTTTQTVTPGTPVTYTVVVIEGTEPERVFAQLSSPGTGGSGEPISQLPEIEFSPDMPGGWTWSVTFNAPEDLGTYKLVVYAAYCAPTYKLSEPAFTALRVVESTKVSDWMVY